MKFTQHFIILIASFMAGLLCVIIVTWSVDPAHIFDNGRYEQELANILLQGYNAADVTDCEERELQEYYIDNMQQTNDVIVIGSSRSMQIRSYLFPENTFFNHSVSGAAIPDYISIFGLYEQRGFTPDVVILGIDPWIFNRNNNQTRWTEIKDSFTYMVSKLPQTGTFTFDVPDEKLGAAMQLLSWPYFRTSVKTLISGDNIQFYATMENESDGNMILADGSLVYGSAIRNQSQTEIDGTAVSYAYSDPVFGLGDFTELDNDLVKMFTAFIDYIQEKGVTCVFYLPPYHPITYSILSSSERYRIILEVEESIRQIAAEKGIQVLGGYDPADSYSSEEEFYDGMHPRESSIEKAFGKLGFGVTGPERIGLVTGDTLSADYAEKVRKTLDAG